MQDSSKHCILRWQKLGLKVIRLCPMVWDESSHFYRMITVWVELNMPEAEIVQQVPWRMLIY